MILDYYESPLKRKIKGALTKPHQPFFIAGVFVAVFSMLALFGALFGCVDIDLRLYHTYNLTLILPTFLFFGFLFTVLYRFLLVMPFLQEEYMSVFWLLLLSTLFLQAGFFIHSSVVQVGMFGALLAQILGFKSFLSAYKKSTVNDKSEIFWILTFFATGILGSALFLLSLFVYEIQTYAVNISFFLYAVGVVFAIAQKMVPNFFTIYFGIEQPPKNTKILPIILFALFGIAIAKSAQSHFLLLISSALGVAATAYWLRQNRFMFRKSPSILWVLLLSLVWFLAGFVFGILEAMGIVLALIQTHIFGIGFMTGMILGFGSRVAMGHSGRKIASDNLTTSIFLLVQAVLIFRLIGLYLPMFTELAAGGWLLFFAFWAYKYLPMLTTD